MGKYDLLIAGAGLTGATVARIAADRGKKVLVLERRDRIGGNCRDELMEGINVHLYGPHIFHTSNHEVWRFVNKFAEFNHFRYCPLAKYGDRLYNLPFNMHTFYQLYGILTPAEARDIIKLECSQMESPANLEEKAISLVGEKVYNTLIKGYTEKQWGRPCRELSPDIITRLPIRLTYDNNYFNDSFQGIPVNGYSTLITKMLDGIEVRTGVDFLKDKQRWTSSSDKVLYTGAIDEFFDYKYGALDYRSLRWEHTLYECPDKQGIAVINHTDAAVPYTRTIEHKHFDFGQQPVTIVSKEFPVAWDKSKEPFYPIGDTKNRNLYTRYIDLAKATFPSVHFGGRMGLYRYLDMDKSIAEAFITAKILFDDTPPATVS